MASAPPENENEQDQDSRQPPAALLRSVTKSFGRVLAVRDLDLELRTGEIVALLGPNGAGKSTTVEMMVGLTEPDAGTVSVFGRAPRRAVLEGRVGAMLQAGALLQEARVIDVLQLMHGLHARPLSLAEVIERADVGGFLRTRTDKLSGGQAQRLRYAMAIMPDPDLLILDEPTVGMDVEIRRRFWASMRAESAEGRTVVFATHYLEEADDVADRIVVLRQGSVVADGTGAQLRARVAGRTISLAVDSVSTPAGLDALPGATSVEARGARLVIQTGDSDATLRALLARCPDARDIEVTAAASLEDAFLALTEQSPAVADAPRPRDQLSVRHLDQTERSAR